MKPGFWMLPILFMACSYPLRFEKSSTTALSRNTDSLVIADSSEYRDPGGILISKYVIEYPFAVGQVVDWKYYDFIDSVKNMGGNLVLIDSAVRADTFFSYWQYYRIFGRVFYDSSLSMNMHSRDSGEALLFRTDSRMGGLSPIQIFKGDSLLCDLKGGEYFRIRYAMEGGPVFTINKKYAVEPNRKVWRDIKSLSRNTGGLMPDGAISIGMGGIMAEPMNELKFLFWRPRLTACGDPNEDGSFRK